MITLDQYNRVIRAYEQALHENVVDPLSRTAELTGLSRDEVKKITFFRRYGTTKKGLISE